VLRFVAGLTIGTLAGVCVAIGYATMHRFGD
jgi:hypothetical protein